MELAVVQAPDPELAQEAGEEGHPEKQLRIDPRQVDRQVDVDDPVRKEVVKHNLFARFEGIGPVVDDVHLPGEVPPGQEG